MRHVTISASTPSSRAAHATACPALPADTERAFERFYLHERYGLERRVGTGLGLAIVKELTLAMGGDVDVESRPGELTVFTVRLRVPKVAARATLPA